jgi:hypothetical protein
MTEAFRQSELEAYLDEALPAEEMTRIEQALCRDGRLVEQLVTINSRRDRGLHSLGEIWRRHRLSCPSRQQLGCHLMGTLSKEEREYIVFHVECRVSAPPAVRRSRLMSFSFSPTHSSCSGEQLAQVNNAASAIRPGPKANATQGRGACLFWS